MIYKPMAGSSISQEHAQVVGEFLEQLGEFTPSDIVEAARPETSPIHEDFEWDDLAAAEKYRVDQARHLVNRISVVITVNNKAVETRAFHSITIQTADEKIEQRYTAIKLISANPDMREQVIDKALRELEGWKERYESYRDIFGTDIFATIETTTSKVRRRSIKRPSELQPQA